MKKGIGLIGADGTGKTTLLNLLTDYYGDAIFSIRDVARGVIKSGYPLGKNASTESYIALCTSHMKALYNVAATKKAFISERTLIDSYCYAKVNASLPRPGVRSSFISFLESIWKFESCFYASYIYFPVEFEITPDGVREPDREYQRMIDEKFRQIIKENDINVLTVSGTVDRRFVASKQLIDQLIGQGVI